MQHCEGWLLYSLYPQLSEYIEISKLTCQIASTYKYVHISDGERWVIKGKIPEQKMVYATVNHLIQTGELHALGIKAYTRSEWADLQA